MNFRAWLVVAFYGVLLASVASGALKNTRKFKIATTTTTTTTTSTEKPSEQPENEASADEIEGTTVTADVNATTARVLTGIPQIDYIWDPNLPRELNGYNLSDYPFYSSIPPLDEIDFKCDGLHDGFYASVPHKCQVYHHCLFGTRYDFLCANFTAFDQKTFICHFASEVDCANSKKYWHRNDALYKAATTTAPPPTTTTVRTTTTTSAPPAVTDVARPAPRRRRPLRRRPAYDYYEEDYYDDEYERPRSRGSVYHRPDEYEYEERPYNRRDHMRNRDREYREPALIRPRDRFPSRSNRRDPVMAVREPDDVEEDRQYDRGFPRDDYEDKPAAAVTHEPPAKPVTPSASIYARTRPPLKPRRPTPAPQQDRFAYKTAVSAPVDNRRPPARSSEPPAAPEDDYYDDELEDMRPRRPMRRRPYRERDRHFYDQLRDMRDRPAIRTRYRNEEEETRPRKYPERPSNRDRLFERARDRALDRPKPDLPVEKPSSESRPALRLSVAREKVAKEKTSTEGPPHPPKFPHDDDKSERDFVPKPTAAPKNDKASDADKVYGGEKTGLKPEEGRGDDYALNDEYYDEPEYSSPAPPRPAFRVVKRPFLPSRGGNPNPRGLSPVGLKAMDSVRREPVVNSTTVGDRKEPEENSRGADKYQIKPAEEDGVRYHAYKDDNRRPIETLQASKDTKWSQQENNSEIKPAVPWNAEDYRRGHLFSSNEQRKNLIGASGPAVKQGINEVTHPLQDIPDSEYDVTLNEALTPAFNQDSLPSGFILPHQRREPVLQPSENNYRVSRPNYSQQLKQKTFIPSPQFIPSTRVAANERSTSVQYFKSPEQIPASDVAPRQPGRSTWHDYTGY